ncbi:MAG TPA: RNA polymerase sigma factor [Gaiellaceae bacterium]
MEELGDAELLRAARRDPDAFCLFYERHAVRLHGWLRKQTGGAEVAGDLTAESFAQALVSLRRFRGGDDEQAAAWLYGIARNLVFQYQRKLRVESSARSRLGMPIRDYSEYEESDESLDAEALTPQLRDAVAGLSDSERDALNLRVVGQLTYEEVAEELSIGVPAARMRVSRALQTLRTRLTGANQ